MIKKYVKTFLSIFDFKTKNTLVKKISELNSKLEDYDFIKQKLKESKILVNSLEIENSKIRRHFPFEIEQLNFSDFDPDVWKDFFKSLNDSQRNMLKEYLLWRSIIINKDLISIPSDINVLCTYKWRIWEINDILFKLKQ